MWGRIRSATTLQKRLLSDGWELLGVPKGSIEDPSALPASGWLATSAPATVASALRASGAFTLDGPPQRFDADDWWWRLRFDAPAEEAAETRLCFDGLATLAEIWLNGVKIGASANMFVAHELPVTLAPHNELVLRFASLEHALTARRPRPRWRVPMLEQQQLRWFRTTLLGRTPGWSPPCPAVGPYRAVSLQQRSGACVSEVQLATQVVEHAGSVEFSATLLGGAQQAELVLTRGGREHRAACPVHAGRIEAKLEVPDVALWWPHTHGEPALYTVHLELDGERIELGSAGFRTLTIQRENGDFDVRVNGVSVFCRGACWTPPDAVSLNTERSALAPLLAKVVAGGMNMLRVGGTMVYESDDFYDLCDELGILVWQEFMFANMDYPEDEAFTNDVLVEARQIVARLAGRPCLALFCGSSEGEQQASMWGAPRELWQPRLFHEVLPAVLAELSPSTPYWPSSAHGGDFPHLPASGTTSYYGVGAYQRPLEDARRSEIRFASECLAFANVPGPETLPGGPSVRVHHPAWKARSPRDLGAGWDFDDVRDHYVERLFGVDSREVRYGDHDRYLELARVAVGEVMAATYSEWRRRRSQCRGALIWFLKDFWPSAGWGVFESNGAPKSAYWYLRRVLQPLFLGISDEGLNGLVLHPVNESERTVAGELSVRLFKNRETLVSEHKRAIELAPREAREIPIAALLDGFHDLSYAYRFGPPGFDLVTATLRHGDGEVTTFALPLGFSAQHEADLGLSARCVRRAPGEFEVTLSTRRFAHAIALNAPGLDADDDYFNLAPGAEKVLRLRRTDGADSLRGSLQALNASTPVALKLPS